MYLCATVQNAEMDAEMGGGGTIPIAPCFIGVIICLCVLVLKTKCSSKEKNSFGSVLVITINDKINDRLS